MRCKLSDKKVKRLRKKTGLPVVSAFVRGNTDHRIDLLIEGGSIVNLYKDGTIEHCDGMIWKP